MPDRAGQALPDGRWSLPGSARYGVARRRMCVSMLYEVVRALARLNGGLIGWGEISPDAPRLNVEAMVRSFAESGD